MPKPRKKRGLVLRRLRQGLLLYVLAMVALGTWLSRVRSTDWNDPLYVAIYPINGDGSETAQRYVENLELDEFTSIETFFVREAQRYGVDVAEPLVVDLGEQVFDQPPEPPVSRSVHRVMAWSLKMRYWAWSQERAQDLPSPDIRVFVRYFDPETTEVLAHSLGLQKGLLGVVNAYATREYRGSNGVVIAHEILHTLGASDKYAPSSALPEFPDGYADPDATPLYPQTRAEVMGGRIPISSDEADMPRTLRDVVVGRRTATEIRWIQSPR